MIGGDPIVWRLLRTEPARGSWNMAVDEVLMESVRTSGVPTLRFYEWSPACVSLGRNQPARAEYATRGLDELGVDLVRRPTGGRAVLHDRELTYSVVAPSGLLGGPRRAYQRINRVVAGALRALGADVTMSVATQRPAPPPSSIPCFAEPLPGEILVAGRKVVGSAQLHRDRTLLQHGSILLEPSAHAAAIHERTGIALDASAGYLADAGGDPADVDLLCSALAKEWAAEVGPLCSVPLTRDELFRVSTARDRFAGSDWTWRR